MPSRVPALFKRGEIYHYRFQVDGRRVERSTHETRREVAEQVAAEAFRVAILRSRGEEPEPTLSGLVDQWLLAHRLIVSPAHAESVETFGRLHLQGLGSLQISQLNTKTVEAARADFLAGHEKSSANQWFKILRLLVRWALRQRMIRQIPWEEIKPLKSQQKPRPTFPTPRTRDWLGKVVELTQEEPAIAQAVRLILGMGLRISEAVSARWEWMDLERGVYTPGDTKGREAWPRPMPEWLRQELLPVRKNFGLVAAPINGKTLKPDRVRRWIRRACRELGISYIKPHGLRSEYATLLSESGVPIQDVQYALAHKDPRTTMGYLKRDLDRVTRAQITIAARQGMDGRKSGAPHGSNAAAEPREVLPVVMPHEGEGESA